MNHSLRYWLFVILLIIYFHSNLQAQTIFIDAGSTLDSSICTIIIGVVNFIATFIATLLIDRLGRKVCHREFHLQLMSKF